jgi:hypothetical protein
MSKFKIECTDNGCVLVEIKGKRKYKCSNEFAQQLVNRVDNIIDESEFALEFPFSAKRWYGKTYDDYVSELSKTEYGKRVIVSKREYEKWITPYAVPVGNQSVDWGKVHADIFDILNGSCNGDHVEATNKVISYLKIINALRKLG